MIICITVLLYYQPNVADFLAMRASKTTMYEGSAGIYRKMCAYRLTKSHKHVCSPDTFVVVSSVFWAILSTSTAI